MHALLRHYVLCTERREFNKRTCDLHFVESNHGVSEVIHVG